MAPPSSSGTRLPLVYLSILVNPSSGKLVHYSVAVFINIDSLLYIHDCTGLPSIRSSVFVIVHRQRGNAKKGTFPFCEKGHFPSFVKNCIFLVLWKRALSQFCEKWHFPSFVKKGTFPVLWKGALSQFYEKGHFPSFVKKWALSQFCEKGNSQFCEKGHFPSFVKRGVFPVCEKGTFTVSWKRTLFKWKFKMPWSQHSCHLRFWTAF
jgi:hypothetical protein